MSQSVQDICLQRLSIQSPGRVYALISTPASTALSNAVLVRSALPKNSQHPPYRILELTFVPPFFVRSLVVAIVVFAVVRDKRSLMRCVDSDPDLIAAMKAAAEADPVCSKHMASG